MAKKKRSGKPTKVKRCTDELFTPKDEEIPDEKSSSYYHDEIDDFHIQREEKLLLKDKDYLLPKDYGQEEVLGLGDESEEDEDHDYHFDPDHDDEGSNDMDYQDSHVIDEQDDMASDIEDEKDDLPDVRAWGKKKSAYYDTDYIDKGYRDYRESDAEAAEAEEKEILALEKRLTEEMQEDDFGLKWLEKKEPEKHNKMEEKIELDLQSLSKEEKLELLGRTCPELLDFRDDFLTKLTELREKLQPIIDQIKGNKIPPGCWRDYVLVKYQTILQYCTNISFYFVLKAKGIQTTDHPVIKRILQFRKLLKQLESIEIQPLARSAESAVKNVQFNSHTSEERDRYENSDTCESEVEENADIIEETKRGITYEIEKNKGLTPYRKKELRNPRVKHRRKYERAKVRRRGQVREAISEVIKYGGEHSGIRTSVIKSTKLK